MTALFCQFLFCVLNTNAEIDFNDPITYETLNLTQVGINGVRFAATAAIIFFLIEQEN